MLLLVSAFTTSLWAQNYFIVKGRVTAAATGLPMQGASVFAQNTTLGTATDADGYYKLYLPQGGYTLAVTFTGYNTESIRVSNSEPGDVNFALHPREKEMADVAVVATTEVKDGWNKYGSFFVSQFIGQGANSAACNIKNPEVLKFYFSRKKNRLKVMAAEVLQIENKSLGYTISYALDSFTYEYKTETAVYTGSPLYTEMLSSDSIQQMSWQLAREKAYKGSILHFMRSVYHQTLREEQFEIQFLVNHQGRDTAIALKNIYAALNFTKDDSTGLVEIKPNQSRLGIIYLGEKPSALYQSMNADEPTGFQFSILQFPPGESLGIEPNGYYFEQNDIVVNAYWSWEKIADQLPYNYGWTINSTQAAPEPQMSIQPSPAPQGVQ